MLMHLHLKVYQITIPSNIDQVLRNESRPHLFYILGAPRSLEIFTPP